MTNFAILRTAKLTSFGNIASSADHCFRTRDTPNADPARLKLNKSFGPAESTSAVCQAIKDRLKSVKVRKNAVLAVEYMITTSPEVWEERPEVVNKYLADARRWLIEKHGAENVISVSLHYDEKTPHLSAYVVPIDPRGKLNASHFFDGRDKCSAFQTEFWENCAKKFGLDRGIEGSTAKHTTLKQYYANLNKKNPEILVEKDDLVPRVTKKGLIMDKRETPEQVAERVAKTISKRAAPLQAKAKQADADKAKHEALAANLAALRRESARLRELDLDAVFEALGAVRDPDAKKNWRIGSGRFSVKEGKWYDFNQGKGKGGAIDLVMYVNEMDFKGAVQWLGSHFGSSATTADAMHRSHAAVKSMIEEPPKPFAPPAPVPANWPVVRDYLTRTRKIAERIVDSLHEQKRIFADKFHNAVFLLGQGEGVELRGTSDVPYHRTHGKKALFEIRRGDAKTAAFVEAPIDALSFLELMRFKGRVVSVGGNNEKRMLERAAQLRGEGYELVAAFDNDETGDKLAAQLGGQRLTPPGGAKDWNEALQRAKTPPVGATSEALIADIRAAARANSPRPRNQP